MLLGIVAVDRLAQRIPRADDETHLQFDIQLAARAENGRSSPGSLICPFGRRTGVPLTITDDARPLYPIGISDQFGSSAFFGSRNIEPTFVACSFDE